MNEVEIAKRKFFNNPDIESAKNYIVTSRRFSVELPSFSCDVLNLSKARNTVKCFIEAMDYGNPSLCAYYMVIDNESDRKWAEAVIENDKTGSAGWAAYHMTAYCKSDRSWAEKIIENNLTPGFDLAVYNMVRECGSSQQWADKILSIDLS